MSDSTTSRPVIKRSLSISHRVTSLVLPLAILATLLLFGLVEPRVWSLGNIQNIIVQASFLAIFAMAQTFVILTRGFDLSLGCNISLISVVSAMVMVNGGDGTSVLLGMGAALLTGAAIGLTNGVLIAGFQLNALVVTLGMANIILALASTVSGGFPLTGLPPVFNAVLSQGKFLGLFAPIWVLALIFIVLGFVLTATKFGRSLYIIGANPKAARAAGIRTAPAVILAYTICGVLTAIGAIMLTARTGSGEPNLGGNLTLESIAAAVVGGVRLTGGEGGVTAALIGALFITVLSNGMNLIQVDGYLQQIFLGLIIITSLVVVQMQTQR
ncbi:MULTISPECIES: ABC transporter permease [Ochrobactrum]|uniref:ABC transporter permease n=1 Tax=Ochrobactrum quorumnocens TaxID=271865 RepID=A0A5N1JZI1_9HYPH|nr:MULTISPECIES: ABC transporter permease [Brucella/Ochrobactrum group]KAA9367434.1 ABC transporter permease [[Ochrobactrum] quorumnocens]MBD7992213.1 ABC transporter permease [Ochrobactrum gallinarum]MDH7792362.1 ribose transport system permease protein [Ochrobactrum sp. AN78]